MILRETPKLIEALKTLAPLNDGEHVFWLVNGKAEVSGTCKNFSDTPASTRRKSICGWSQAG